MLSSWILTAEAEHCRLLAAEFAGRPEGLVSLRLAGAFDDLEAKFNSPSYGWRSSVASRSCVIGRPVRGS